MHFLWHNNSLWQFFLSWINSRPNCCETEVQKQHNSSNYITNVEEGKRYRCVSSKEEKQWTNDVCAGSVRTKNSDHRKLLSLLVNILFFPPLVLPHRASPPSHNYLRVIGPAVRMSGWSLTLDGTQSENSVCLQWVVGGLDETFSLSSPEKQPSVCQRDEWFLLARNCRNENMQKTWTELWTMIIKLNQGFPCHYKHSVTERMNIK